MEQPPLPQAFTVEHASKLSGLSRRQLTMWDESGFYRPSNTGFYSFRDLVALRTLGELRNQRKIPLQTLRRFSKWLHRHQSEPWATMRFATAGKEVLVYDEQGRLVSGTKPGQGADVVPYPIQDVFSTVERDARQLNKRHPDDVGKIVRTRGVLGSSPRIAGTRIPTSTIWALHRDGVSIGSIVSRYPHLTKRDVEAAIEFEKTRNAA